MKLENLVTSLAFSQKLCEIGIKQESFFYWIFLDKNHPLYETHKKIRKSEDLECLLDGIISYGKALYHQSCTEFIHYSAFTASELGEMLPEIGKWKMPWKHKNKWYSDIDISDGESTEANARAKLIIYLVENGFIKLSEAI